MAGETAEDTVDVRPGAPGLPDLSSLINETHLKCNNKKLASKSILQVNEARYEML